MCWKLFFWIIGFVLGSLLCFAGLGRALEFTPTFSGFFFLFSLILVGKSRYGGAFAWASGFFWGITHLAPFPQEGFDLVEIGRKNTIPRGSHVVVTKDQLEFLAKGNGELGQKGNLWIRDGHAEFKPYERKRERSSVLSQRVDDLDISVQGFFRAIILGQTRDLGSDLLTAFQRLGLYHLLAISGLHLTYVSMLIKNGLSFPFQLAYSLCLIRPGAWFLISWILRFLALFVVAWYSDLIGFPASVQRAFLLFILDQISGAFGAKWDKKRERLLAALCFHAFLFPLDVFSLSSVLSWVSYTTLMIFYSGKIRDWLQVALSQAVLTFFVAGLLGQMCIAGFFLNLLILPIFPFLTFWMLPPLMGDLCPVFLRNLGATILLNFLDILKNLGSFAERSPFFFQEWDSWICRSISLGLAFGGLFFLYRRGERVLEKEPVL